MSCEETHANKPSRALSQPRDQRSGTLSPAKGVGRPTHGVRVDPDQSRVGVSLESAGDGSHRLQTHISVKKRGQKKDKGDRIKEPTDERVVAAESDGQLSLARVSVNALGHLLVDLRAVHNFSISTVIPSLEDQHRRLRWL